MTSIEKKILAGVDAILGAEGMLAKTAGMTFSKQQYEYAQRAARGFTRFDAVGGRTAINMLQAATGTGKTLGYLVPLMLYAAYSRPRARVAISTFTRQLQKQILDKDAAQASQWVGQLTGVELSVALRLGIGNFVSASAAARLRDELAQEKTVSRFEDAIDFLDELIEWSEETDAHGVLIRSGLLYDFIQERNKVVLPYGIILSRIALSGAAPIEERAAYEAMVMASKNADVLIVNHALVAMNASRWSSLLDDPDGRRIAVLVCDEADRLADAAELVAGADMALHELLRTCQNIELPDVTTAARELYEYVVAMDVPNREALAIKNRSELAGRINRTLTVLRPVAASGVRFLEVVQDVTGEDNTKRRAATAAFVDAVQTLADVSMSIGRNDTTAIVSWSPVRR